MALVEVDSKHWDIIDEPGRHLHDGASPAQGVQLPRTWRVFGPVPAEMTDVKVTLGVSGTTVAKPKVLPDIEQLAETPDQLTIDGKSYTGVDVGVVDNFLNLDAALNGHDSTEGYQAYAFARFSVSEETEVILGAGADWWMQLWLDGQPVYDTLATGNGSYMTTAHNHAVRYRLGKGSHTLAALVISGSLGTWGLHTDILTPRQESYAKVDPDQWSFLTDPDEIYPQRTGSELHKAFRTDLVLTDETLECEYQLDCDNGQVGIIFAAQDSDHYYWAYIPHWGQLWRARAFYAAIAIADGTGFLRHLELKLMPNVPAQLNLWRTLRVERRGHHIQMWVNGVKGPSAIDDTYGPGRIGVSTFNSCTIRNLKVDGKSGSAPAWPQKQTRKRNFKEHFTNHVPYSFHMPGPLVKLSNGQTLMFTNLCTGVGSLYLAKPADWHRHMFVTEDAGRTWSPYGEPLCHKDDMHLGWVFELTPGTLRACHYYAPQNDTQSRHLFPKEGFYYRDSTDAGLSWSPTWTPAPMDDPHGHLAGTTRAVTIYGSTILHDGTLVATLQRNANQAHAIENVGQGTWPVRNIIQPYCTRSEDHGLSWSPPVPMDDAAMRHGDPPDGPIADFTETPMAQLPNGRLIAITRPSVSPFMWQTHSDDGGKSWSQCCYAPFSSAGSPQMVATQSGYLALIARCTGVGMHISTDGGVNWSHGALLDTPGYFNGVMAEVEPDVVIFAYPVVETIPGHLRTMRVRVTPDGPVPAD